jgi:hypothetical protein
MLYALCFMLYAFCFVMCVFVFSTKVCNLDFHKVQRKVPIFVVKTSKKYDSIAILSVLDVVPHFGMAFGNEGGPAGIEPAFQDADRWMSFKFENAGTK